MKLITDVILLDLACNASRCFEDIQFSFSLSCFLSLSPVDTRPHYFFDVVPPIFEHVISCSNIYRISLFFKGLYYNDFIDGNLTCFTVEQKYILDRLVPYLADKYNYNNVYKYGELKYLKQDVFDYVSTTIWNTDFSKIKLSNYTDDQLHRLIDHDYNNYKYNLSFNKYGTLAIVIGSFGTAFVLLIYLVKNF